jgi:hypothetical protein
MGFGGVLLPDPQLPGAVVPLQRSAANPTHWGYTRTRPSDGLGYWTARLRTDLPADRTPPGLGRGAVVGIGGCAVRAGTD